MPLTPLHVVPAWLIWAASRGRLDFRTITVGSMLADLEVIPVYLLTRNIDDVHGILHTFWGAVLLVGILSWLVVNTFHEPLFRWAGGSLHGRWFFKIGGKYLGEERNPIALMVLSGALGGLTHSFVDILTHSSNNTFWPLIPNGYPIFLGGTESSSILITNLALLGVSIFFLRAYWQR